mmetsp:Transcript_122568/g.306116  ORF Transcript_122568/g.306116 Transcript_122568/m.306116 type:complete len:190 (-) Transcript_122568:14-583(-)
MPVDISRTPWNAMKNYEIAINKEKAVLARYSAKRSASLPSIVAPEPSFTSGGTRFHISGMRSRPHLNGAVAEALSEELDEDGYMMVRVAQQGTAPLGTSLAAGKTLRVQPQCLQPLADSGISSQVSLSAPRVTSRSGSASRSPSSSLRASAKPLPRSTTLRAPQGAEVGWSGVWDVSRFGIRVPGWGGY